MTAEYSAGSKLEKIFKSGQKAVTGECGPPRGADADHFRHKANFLKDVVDAVNVTDNQTAVVRFCSMAAAKILLEMGVEPVMQMVTRDMNRIALQSNILGAAAMGIKNLLCLTGDHQTFGDHPQAKNVHDLDSVMLAHTLKDHAGRGQDDQRHRGVGPAPDVHRGRGQPLRRSPGVPGGAHGQEDQRRGPVHPDPVHL